jgi:hypothetical protein
LEVWDDLLSCRAVAMGFAVEDRSVEGLVSLSLLYFSSLFDMYLPIFENMGTAVTYWDMANL